MVGERNPWSLDVKASDGSMGILQLLARLGSQKEYPEGDQHLRLLGGGRIRRSGQAPARRITPNKSIPKIR